MQRRRFRLHSTPRQQTGGLLPQPRSDAPAR